MGPCRSDSILHDPRNRQLLVYVRLIEFLQPEFVLLEQVLDILLKENGVYVKTMTANLIRMGYQARTGTLITGAYGCPQVRCSHLYAFLDFSSNLLQSGQTPPVWTLHLLT